MMLNNSSLLLGRRFKKKKKRERYEVIYSTNGMNFFLVPLFSAASIFSKSGRWSYERELGAKTKDR